MTPELAALATARHAAFIEWDKNPTKGSAPREGLFEKFVAANRAYVLARDNEQRQITKAAA